jgi:hypothetical protein
VSIEEDSKKLEKIIQEQNKAYEKPLPARWPIIFERIEIDDIDKKEN